MDKEEIMEALRKVYDPEHPLSVVDLKIVEDNDVTLNDGRVSLTFTPTSPYCPMGGVIGVLIKYALEKKFGGNVEVTVKPGTHVQEALLNEILHDEERYATTLKKLETSGMLKQCIAL